MKRFTPSEIEPKWQKIWADDARYRAPDESDKPKYYVTGMFPYPSGAGMHTGHFFEHSIVDAVARYKRATGHNVMYPMGWDAFGLPAENYAIKTGTAPAVSTEQNIANFTNQLQRVGASIDWSREITTSHPDYYRWTQWVFTKFYERGLAYQKEASQWWCPVDKTVLANEQVEDGKCWRCGSEVEKKSMKQWFFKITDYADALLEETPELNWPEKIKTAQTNWIGKSDGIIYKNKVRDTDLEIESFSAHFEAFTANTFAVIAPDHPFLPTLVEGVENADEILAAAKEMVIKRDSEGPGSLANVEGIFTGRSAVDIFGDEDLPIWIANYALADYGTGIVLCSAHDERDFEFAQKYDIRLKPSMVPIDPIEAEKVKNLEYCFTDMADGVLIEPKAFEGKIAGSHRQEIVKYLEHEGYATSTIKYKMRDWLISRQRYWGAPIPVIHCTNCFMPAGYEFEVEFKDENGFSALVSGQKNVFTRAMNKEYKNLQDGSVLKVVSGQKNSAYVVVKKSTAYETIEELFATDIPKRTFLKEFASVDELREEYEKNRPGYTKELDEHGIITVEFSLLTEPVSVPEKDLPVLLPEVEDYEPKGESVLASQTDWVNTTCPTCGGPAKRETDTMDGYACSSWYLLRYTDPQNDQAAWAPEKAKYWTPIDMYVGGDHAVAHLLYVRFWNHVFYDMGFVPTKEPVGQLVYHGLIQAEDGRKMSKSLGNVVDPLEVIDAGYGADALRTFELFLGPINENSNWSSKGIAGVHRFLNRVWTITQEYMEAEKGDGENAELTALQHKTIKKVTRDIERLSFNTAIAALMEYVNDLYKLKTSGFSDEWQAPIESLVQMVQPFAPHVAAELWQQLGHDSQLDFEAWPTWDEARTVADTITVVVQVNGKVRAKLEVAADASEDSVKEAALAEENVQKFVGDKKPTKVIYVPGRLVSVVVK